MFRLEITIGKAINLVWRNGKIRIAHTKWLENLLFENLIEGLSSQHFNDPANNIGSVGIFPAFTGLKCQRHFCQALGRNFIAYGAFTEVDFLFSVMFRQNPCIKPIGQSRCMGKHLMQSWGGSSFHLINRNCPFDQRLTVRKLWKKIRYRSVEMKQPALRKLHQRHRGDHLRHRIDANNGIPLIWLVIGDRPLPVTQYCGNFSAPGQQNRRSCIAPKLYIACHPILNSVQTVRIKSQPFGIVEFCH